MELKVSDYSYVAGNPIMFVDLDGKKIIFPNFMSVSEATKWLKELGIEDEFRINKRGVLKKRLTPFQANNSLTKSLNKKRRTRDVYEISYADNDAFHVQWWNNSEDIQNSWINGSYSREVSAQQEGLPIGKRRTVTLGTIVHDENISYEAAQFIGAILGVDGENAARKILGMTPVENSTLNRGERHSTNTDGYDGSIGNFPDDDAVNAVPVVQNLNSDGNIQGYRLNQYDKVFVRAIKMKKLK